MGRFHNDPKCRVFLGQIKTGGASIDLSCADLVVFYNQWWSPGENNQAADRAHRQGQKNKVTIIPLVTRTKIERHYFRWEWERTNKDGSPLLDKFGNQLYDHGLIRKKTDWIKEAIDGKGLLPPTREALMELLRDFV